MVKEQDFMRKGLVITGSVIAAAGAIWFLRPAGEDSVKTTPPAPEAKPAPAAAKAAVDSEKPERRVEPMPEYAYASGMRPGETRPGSRPDTIIVQPVTPGPPKEIKANYRVPTPDEDPRIDRTEDGELVFNDAITMARHLHDPAAAPEEDVEILEAIIGYYRMVYSMNPVAGENADVLYALTGNNPQNIVVFPDDHPDLSANGELLDRWGNPYFFHALSRTSMDIWSSGTDGKLGTADDVKLGAEDPSLQLEGDLE